MYKKLPELPEFIKGLSLSFEDTKSKMSHSSIPDGAYFKTLEKKTERLNIFNEYLLKQEEYINAFYYGLRTSILEVIDESQQRAIQQLREQAKNMDKLYEDFESNLKRAYLSYEETEEMYPSLERLQKTFERVRSASKLEELIQSMKDKLSLDEDDMLALETDEFKKDFFNYFMEIIQQEENKRPEARFRHRDAKEEVRVYMKSFLKGIFRLSDSIIPDIRLHMAQNSGNFAGGSLMRKDEPDSLISLSDFEDLTPVIQWLPKQYKGLMPKMIYHGSRDGMNAKKFHQLCDQKGATVTLIECIFDGATESTKIGGFLDHSWNSEGYIYSDEAFLFSVNAQVKCPLAQKGKAAYGRAAYGPRFCADGPDDLFIFETPTKSSIEPSNYKNSIKLINSPAYPGSGKIFFEIIDIKVFIFE